MKEKIIAALKTKYSNLGFGDKAIAGVADFLSATVTEETSIETAIAGVEPILKAFQGEIDRRVTPLQSELETLKKKPDAAAEAAAAAAKKAAEEAAKANPEFAAKMTALETKLAEFEKKAAQAAHTEKIRAELKTKGVPETFFKHLPLSAENDTDVAAQIEAINATWVEHKQGLINQGLMTEAPARPTPEQEKSEIDSYLKEKFPESKQ